MQGKPTLSSRRTSTSRQENLIRRTQNPSLTNTKNTNMNTKKNSAPLQSLEKIIFELKNDHIETSSKSAMKYFDNKFPYSFNLFISSLIYTAFLSQRNDAILYLNFMKSIETLEKGVQCNSIINVFKNYLLRLKSQESNHLLTKMIEYELIQPDFVQNKRSLCYANYYSDEEIHSYNYKFQEQFLIDLEELSKNDWELHKQLIKEGVNPNEILKIIRNDEIEKLQEISSQTNFDFNQHVKPSLYERYSFINEKNVSIIDFAAFFGAIKCFRFLLMNGSTIENTLKYAIAGGNLEITYLCEQNILSIEEVYKTAIEFHRNEIFQYFYEKKKIPNKDLTKYGMHCLRYCNFKMFMFLKSVGMKINKEILEEAILNGNTFFIKRYITDKKYFPIISNCPNASRNYELIKMILEQGDFNKITLNIGLTCLKFVLIDLCFLFQFKFSLICLMHNF